MAVPLSVAEGSQGVAIDGKAQRGRLPLQTGGCPVHAAPVRKYPAFCYERRVVLAQEPIECGEDKSEGELTVAPALVAGDPRTGGAWPGRVLTGDALFCLRTLCAQVLAAGGDSLLLVKENQPTLLADIGLLFDPPAALGPAALLDRHAASTRDRGHGRQEEVRRLVASTDLAASLDWPGLAQVCRLERTWRERGKAKQALLYGITSLSPATGPPSACSRASAAHPHAGTRRSRTACTGSRTSRSGRTRAPCTAGRGPP